MYQAGGIRMPKVLWVAIPVLLLALIYGSPRSTWPEANLVSYFFRTQTLIAVILGGIVYYKLNRFLKYQQRYNERGQIFWFITWWVSLTIICGLFVQVDFTNLSVLHLHFVDILYTLGILVLGYFTVCW